MNGSKFILPNSDKFDLDVFKSRMMSIIVLTFLLLNMPRCVIGLFEATRWTKRHQTILFWDFFIGTCLLVSLEVWTLYNLCHRSPHQCFHIRPIRLVITLTTFLHLSRHVDNFSSFVSSRSQFFFIGQKISHIFFFCKIDCLQKLLQYLSWLHIVETNE